MADIKNLKRRSELLRQIRSFFYTRHFFEVQTPILSRGTMIDEFIDPVQVQIEGVQGGLFLQTSPEFEMKRLLLRGCEAVFQMGPAIRAGESGRWHNPEFTILEWYRVGDDYWEGINFLAEFSRAFFPDREVQCMSYREAFQSRFHVDPHLVETRELQRLCKTSQLTVPEDLSLSDPVPWLQLLMAEVIEPSWGSGSAVIVYDWPASQSALAKTRTQVGRDNQSVDVAERFELYVDGIELANGYHELCDYREHRRRLEENNRRRIVAGKKELPIESRFLEDLSIDDLPNCCGTAFGVDRLIAILTGSPQLSDVIAFPLEDV